MSLLKYTSHTYITHTANGEVHGMLSLHAWNLNPSLNPKVNPKLNPTGHAVITSLEPHLPAPAAGFFCISARVNGGEERERERSLLTIKK